MQDLFPHQEIRPHQDRLLDDVTDTLQEGGSLVAHAPTGLGKCVAGDTQILTGEGIGPIEDFSVGDETSCNSFDGDLRCRNSKARIVEKKESSLLRIRTGTGREVKVTPDHKLLRIKEGRIEWVESRGIEEGDFIASPREIELPDVKWSLTVDDIERTDQYFRVAADSPLPDLLADAKENLGYTDRELAEHLDIARKNFTKIRKDYPVRIDAVRKLCEAAGKREDEFRVTKVAYSNKNTIEIPEIDEEFSYFLGMMLGDGSIIGKRQTIGFSSADAELLERFKDMMERFSASVRQVHGADYDYKSSNRSVAWLLQRMGLPAGKKKDMKIPDCVLTSEENLSAFLSGLMDTDGSIDSQGKIELTTKSKQLADQLLVVFPVFGIRPTRTIKTVDGKEYQRLHISNQRELAAFSDEIGFELERKQEKLENSLSKKSNPNKDVVPEIERVLKEARDKGDVPYSRKRLRRRLESYVTGERNPSREGLQELLRHFDFGNSEEAAKLRKLVDTDVFWDEVVSVEEKEAEPVYDATVSENHNFTGNNLLLHNTAAVVPPSLSHALEHGKTVFFLTPRHSQHRIAVETLEQVKEKHATEFTGVDLIGKKWFCNQDGVADLSGRDFRNFCKTLREEERCQFYNNTYDKESLEPTDQARDKVSELEGTVNHAEDMKQEVQEMCPYYMQMMMAAKAEVVIADYFHLFHDGVRDSLFSRMGRNLEDCIVIVDEAHNLPGRVRSLKSSRLSMPQIDNALTEVKKFGFYDMEETLQRLQRELERVGKQELGSEREAHIEKDELNDRIENFMDYQEFIVELEGIADEVREEREKSYCGGIAEFLEDWDGPSNGYARILRRKTSRAGNRYLQIEYSCLDPQVSTKEVLNDSHASILMSGTLTPVDMYTNLCGLNPAKTQEQTYQSAFPAENKKNLVVDRVTTRYKDRSDDEFKKIAWYISKSAEHVPGNIGVFFPSYKLRDDIAAHLELDRDTFREERGMDKAEKQAMMQDLVDVKDDGGAMLGVIGGSFGEGVDYPGKLMNAVFVVGLPLERPDLETKALIDFYDYKFDRGWDYGYAYPAMNRAMQAAGRCIRSKTDRGVVVYMDERYTWGNYRKVFPPEEEFTVTQAPWQEMETFFDT